MTPSDEKVLRIPMKDHLRKASLPTDVTFVFHVFQSKGTKERKHMHDVVFPAHRDRLLPASPYFKSLLSDDWKPTEEVSIEDCQPGAFRILLRWIYGDTAILENVRPSTFIAVLVTAERFNMKDIVRRLVALAEQLFAVSNGFVYNILDALERLQVACAEELTETCFYYLDRNAAVLARHASFLHIRHERLMEILARNSLGINEIDLYRAATKWARAQLKRANKRPTHKAIRKVLGQALFLIRFPTMHPQEFTKDPAKDNVLLAEEKLAIYGRIHSAGPTSCSFSAEPRTGASALPLRQFTPTYCQKCGARLNGGICPECGCSYISCVVCANCGMEIFVQAEAFATSTCGVDRDCWRVAYRCSCGAPSTTTGTGRIRCGRCGLKAWRCGEGWNIMEGNCECPRCKDRYPEDYSDGEQTPSEDPSDDNGDDEH